VVCLVLVCWIMYIVVVRMDKIVLTCSIRLIVYGVINCNSFAYCDSSKSLFPFSVMELALEYEECLLYVFLCAIFRKDWLGNDRFEV